MRCAHAVQVDDSFLSQFGIAAEDKETLIRISSNAVRLHLLLGAVAAAAARHSLLLHAH